MTLEERPETKLPMSVCDCLSHRYQDKPMKVSAELCFSYVRPVLPNSHVLIGVGPQATLLQARVLIWLLHVL